ncbi:MAG: GNAT family N-acetyltransferase [Candidatus Latescibacteria bacterium]|nr:GNAT family N-acetyltransferase [Candidatus Latescibacterota bacterium]
MIVHITVKHSRDHHGREGFRPYVEGQHAVVLEDGDGAFQGELVWRLANIGQGIAEITGMGIADVENRRKGWGSRLLQIAIKDMLAFMRQQKIEPRLVYLLANGQDPVAQAFYEARGFRFLSAVPGLYERGTAWLYARNLSATANE